MASKTLKVDFAVALDGATIAAASWTQSATSSVEVSQSIAASTTNQALTFAVDISAAKAVVLYASGALTLKTNSSGSPQETIALAAGVPLVWNVDDSTDAPFAGDVSVIYVTNASSTDAVQLDMAVVQNAVPS